MNILEIAKICLVAVVLSLAIWLLCVMENLSKNIEKNTTALSSLEASITEFPQPTVVTNSLSVPIDLDNDGGTQEPEDVVLDTNNGNIDVSVSVMVIKEN